MKMPEIDAVKLCQERIVATITLRRVRELRFRCWLARQLVRLAAWIMPGTNQVRIVEEKEEENGI